MSNDTHGSRATRPTLVLGGTGKSGRRVAARLRIGSPAGDPPFDWADRATWAPALPGAGAAYVTYYPDLAFPGAADAVGAFAAVARAVPRLSTCAKGIRPFYQEWRTCQTSSGPVAEPS
jgi:hypothetical protein